MSYMVLDFTHPKTEYIDIMHSVRRYGIDNLLTALETTDFYVAPEPFNDCPAISEGLLLHSLKTLECLLRKKHEMTWSPLLLETSEESLIIMALLHNVFSFYSSNPTRNHTPSVSQYIELTPEEICALHWSTKDFSDPSKKSLLENDIKMYPVILALQQADMEAKYILEISDSKAAFLSALEEADYDPEYSPYYD